MTRQERFQKAQALLLAGQAEAAEALLLQSGEWDGSLLLMLGFACLARGRRVQAADAFTHAAALDPSSPLAELMLATLLAEDGHLDRAAALHRALAERFPGHADIRAATGGFALDSGDLAEAASHLAAALAIAPDSLQARHNLGVACARLGLLIAAERLFRRCGETSRDALANVLFEQGRLEDAQECAISPQFFQAAQALETEDWPLALQGFSRRFAEQPGHAETLRHLAIALDASGFAPKPAFVHASVLGDEAASGWIRLLEATPNDSESAVRLTPMDGLGEVTARREPDAALIRIEDCLFHGNQWHVVKADELSADIAFVWPEGPRRLLGPIAHDGRALLQHAPAGRAFERAILWGCSDNFYHWMADDLPRLPALLAAPSTLPVIFHGRPTAFQSETLALLEFDSRRLTLLSKLERHAARELHVPIATGLPRRPDRRPDREARPIARSTLDWLRAIFRPWRTSGASPRRLFVSRRGARFRRLVNEAEIEALLIDRGFAVIEPEHLSLRDQIGLFSGAEIVIGVHGAGLTNMIFAPEGASLVELHPPGPLPPYFRAIAEALDMRHFTCEGRAVQALRPLKRSFWHFHLDAGALEALVTGLL